MEYARRALAEPEARSTRTWPACGHRRRAADVEVLPEGRVFYPRMLEDIGRRAATPCTSCSTASSRA